MVGALGSIISAISTVFKVAAILFTTPTTSHPLHLTHLKMSAETVQLFALGNPLLDMQVTNGEELLKKYDLKSNDAILVEEKHKPMYVRFPILDVLVADDCPNVAMRTSSRTTR